jgi:hypothetical protein
MTKTNAVFTEDTVFGRRRRQIILRIFLTGVRPLALLLTFACLSASMMFAQNCAPPSGFVASAFSNTRPNPLFRSTLLTKGAPPKKH